MSTENVAATEDPDDNELPKGHPFIDMFFGVGVDSYNRVLALDRLFDWYPDRRLECFAALGMGWSGCDNLWRRCGKFRKILLGASRAELDAMMTKKERAALAQMPDFLQVYRGASHRSRNGLSWSLDREIAARFRTHMGRYIGSRRPAFLYTGTVDKSRVVLKLDRNEAEIIAPKVKVISNEALPPPVWLAEGGA